MTKKSKALTMEITDVNLETLQTNLGFKYTTGNDGVFVSGVEQTFFTNDLTDVSSDKTYRYTTRCNVRFRGDNGKFISYKKLGKKNKAMTNAVKALQAQ